MIKRVNVDRVWKKKPLEVKEEAWNFFKHRFSGEQWGRPRLDEVHFKTISSCDDSMLVGRFDEEEIKMAIWNCGSSKSLGLDELDVV